LKEELCINWSTLTTV